MSIRLRDLIKSVRSCKTSAEERSVIAKECSAIRTAIKDEDAENRHRNVAKLLYMQMLGYPTHFGQMECLKLIVSPYYADKRIGYLGLMLLLDEKQEVLMLVTNSLKNDLNHPNQFVVGLALCSLGNISSTGIARDCAPEIEKLLSSTNPYIRKKAALCAIRILRKVPELMENFIPKVKALLNERNHGVLLTAVTLMGEMCAMEPSNIDYFRKQQLVPLLVRLLKNLVLSGYAPEHDVSGITDPFLQVKILHLLRLLGQKDPEASDAMNDILAQVATNTESTKNVGNSILYESVQTIMAIDSESGLKVMAINILGRFLLNRDNNIRYVGLNTLSKVVNTDIQAVQRHRNTIVDCLKDPDVSIRRRALDLIYSLVNESNIRILVRELLNFLLISDVQFRAELVAKLCIVTEKYAPSKRWHVDTILRVMSIGGNFIPDEVPSNLVALIQSSSELHSYAAQKLYLALTQDQSQSNLAQVGLWCIGEYGDLLIQDRSNDPKSNDEDSISISVSENDVLDLIELILKNPLTIPVTRQYALTALIKLSTRFNASQITRIQRFIENYKSSIHVELQQRACEFTQMFKWDQIRSQVLDHMPVYENAKGEERKMEPIPESKTVDHQPMRNGPTPSADPFDLLGLGDISSMPAQAAAAPAKPAASATLDILGDIFGSPSMPVAPAVNSTPNAHTNLLDLLSGPTPTPAITTPGLFGGPVPSLAPAAAPVSNASANLSFIAYQKNGITITFEVSKQPGMPQLTNVNAICTNSLATPITNFTMQAAVQKYLKIQIIPASGNVLPPNNSGRVTQQIKVANSMHGQKPVLLRLKVDGVLGDAGFTEMGDVAFPAGV